MLPRLEAAVSGLSAPEGELRAGRDHTRDDHSTDDCGRPAPLDSAALDELVETGLAQHAEHGGDVAMRPGALDLEGFFDRLLDARALQQRVDRLDQRRW